MRAEEAEKRGGYGEEKYEKREMQERVREQFLGLQLKGEEESADMVVIDAGSGVEEVAEKILEGVKKVVLDVESGARRRELGVVGAWSGS